MDRIQERFEIPTTVFQSRWTANAPPRLALGFEGDGWHRPDSRLFWCAPSRLVSCARGLALRPVSPGATAR